MPIDLAVDYASARRQFGRPIGSFQAVQHLLADAFVLMEGSRSVARHAAWAVDALAPDDALAAAAVAKAYCARAAPDGVRDRHPGARRHRQHLGVPGPRPSSAGRSSRASVLGGVGANLERVLAHHGIGGDRGLR